MPPPQRKDRRDDRIEHVLDKAMENQAHLVAFKFRKREIFVSSLSPGAERWKHIATYPARQIGDIRDAFIARTGKFDMYDRLIAGTFKRVNPFDNPGVDLPMEVTVVLTPQKKKDPGILIGLRYCAATQR